MRHVPGERVVGFEEAAQGVEAPAQAGGGLGVVGRGERDIFVEVDLVQVERAIIDVTAASKAVAQLIVGRDLCWYPAPRRLSAQRAAVLAPVKRCALLHFVPPPSG